MTRRLTPMSAVTIAIAIVTAGLPHPGVAAPEWSDGACTDNVGITVVVDFQELGGGANVRCAPGPASNGLDALDRADVAWEGTLRFPGFVCRIAGLPTPANDACANTPPADAFWSYWIAPRGGDWCYANVGPASRTPPPGSIEGWSFSFDKAAANIPPPRFEVPGAVPGQAPNTVNGSQCTTAVASTSPGTTVRPATTTSTTTSTSTTSTSTTSTTSTTVSRTSPPTSRSVTDRVIVGSTTVASTTSTLPRSTTTLIDATSEAVQTTSTSPTRLGGETRAVASRPPPSLFEASGRAGVDAAVDARVAGPGTVDLSDDRRDGGGFGRSSVLAILAIAAVAAAGVFTARRRSRPLRVET